MWQACHQARCKLLNVHACNLIACCAAHLTPADRCHSGITGCLTKHLLGAHANMQDSALPHGKPHRMSRPVSRTRQPVPNLLRCHGCLLLAPRHCALCPNVKPFSSHPAQRIVARLAPAMRRCPSRQAPQAPGSLQGR